MKSLKVAYSSEWCWIGLSTSQFSNQIWLLSNYTTFWMHIFNHIKMPKEVESKLNKKYEACVIVTRLKH